MIKRTTLDSYADLRVTLNNLKTGRSVNVEKFERALYELRKVIARDSRIRARIRNRKKK